MKFSILLLLGALIERATLLYGLDCNGASLAGEVTCFDAMSCTRLDATTSMDDAYRHSIITFRVETCDNVKEDIKNVQWYGRLVSCEADFSGHYGVFDPNKAGETGVCFRACIKDTAMSDVMTKIQSVVAKAEGWSKMIYTDAGVDVDGVSNEDAIEDMVDIDVACGYLKAKHMTDPTDLQGPDIKVGEDTVMQNRNKMLIEIRKLRENYPTTIGNLMITYPCSWCHPMMYWCKITKAGAAVGFCSTIPCIHMNSIVRKHFGDAYSCEGDTSECNDEAHKALVIQNIVMALRKNVIGTSDFSAVLLSIPDVDAGSDSVTQNCFINFEGAMYHKNMSKVDCEKVRQFTVKSEHLEHKNDLYHNLLLLGKLKKVTGSDLYFRSTDTCPKGLYYSYGAEGNRVKFCSTGDEDVHLALRVMFTSGVREDQSGPVDDANLIDRLLHNENLRFVMNIAKYIPDLWEEIGDKNNLSAGSCSGTYNILHQCLKSMADVDVYCKETRECESGQSRFDIKKDGRAIITCCTTTEEHRAYFAVKFAEIPHYTVEIGGEEIVPAGVEDLIRIQT